jgi:hypothetical protein
MSKEYNMTEFDIFFISYDEPRCEEFWANLLNFAPWAKRVHGVKGFDNAHKACANQSETDRFITVDGDNLIDEKFLENKINIPEIYNDCVFSWAGKNFINGLVYGNGGLKLWTKDFVLNMKTHENAERDEETVDFCWDKKYIQLNNIYSTTYPNGSPFQAFRAGMREGVKMSLDRGKKIPPNLIKTTIHEKNLKRLIIWMSVGADVENGLWSIYGSRLGLYMANLTDWDISSISNYDWFKDFWNNEIKDKFIGKDYYCKYTKYSWSKDLLIKEIIKIGENIQKHTGLDIALLDENQSKFFKYVYENPRRTGILTTEFEADNGVK